MGRSTAEQALQNRMQIIKQASRLFRARGVEEVSIAEIMASAGMTVGGFYRHFESKEALVQEACALSFEQALKSWHRVAKGESESKIEAIIRHYFKERPADQTCPMLAYATDASAEGASVPARQSYSQGTEALFKLFVEQEPEANESGKRDMGAEQDTAILFAAMVGAKLLVQATNDTKWSQALLETVQGRLSETSNSGE